LDLLEKDERGQGRTLLGVKGNCGPAEGSGRPDTSFGTSIRLILVWHHVIFCCCWVHLFPHRSDFPFWREWPQSNSELAATKDFFDRMPWGGPQLGDDSCVAVGFDITPAIFNLTSRMWAAAGHKQKLKAHRPSEVDKMTYCNQWFWRVGGGRRVLATRPFRTLTKQFVSTDASLSIADMPGYMRGIALGAKYLMWIPVYREVCSSILRDTQGIKVVANNKRNPHKHLLYDYIDNIDEAEVNDFFYATYGVHPDTFRYVEDVPFAKNPGHAWDLPGFEDGCLVDDSIQPTGDVHQWLL